MMNRLFFLFGLVFLAATVSTLSAIAQETDAKHPSFQSAFQTVPFTEVHFNDSFWSPRLKINRDISIPHNFLWCENTGRFSNFAKAAQLLQGDFEGIYFNDSDVYKLLEGTAYSLADHPNSELEKQADRVIAWIAAAQLPNGYLNSYYQLKEPERKWTDTRVRHELYCAGHLIEAAVAYKRATGKETLLEVAEKFVDHITDIFGPEEGRRAQVPGHEEIELALVKLYELTGKKKYLDLSKFFIDLRGDQSKRTDTIYGAYCQDHQPVRDQSEPVGHAVRAVYLYAGMADIAALTGDKELIGALDRLWSSMVNRKLYITGGIGARHQGEAFGDDFELPNRTAYCETCAAIGLVFWAHRMNLLHGDAKYADVVEQAIFNGVLSGIGMDGRHFFYVNPLESAGNHHRQPFFSCACCPTNVVRFVPSLPGYQYSVEKSDPPHVSRGIVLNQFVQGEATIALPDGVVTVAIKTNYPWDGNVAVKINPKPNENNKKKKFNFRVRIPKGVNYIFNGYTPESFHHGDDGKNYFLWEISWNHEANFYYEFDLKPERIVAHPKVEADRGRVALRRGPVVYCFEQVDNEVPVRQIVLAKDPEFKEEFRKDLLGGVVVLKGKDHQGREVTAIPYHAWDHREPGAMAVWVRQLGLPRNPEIDAPGWTDAESGEPILYRKLTDAMLTSEETPETLDFEPTLRASHCHDSDSVEAVVSGEEPKRSDDTSIPRMTFWNHKGTAEWIEIDFGRTRKISKSAVFWFDDTGRGGCRIPQSWSLSYRDGKEWKPVKTSSTYAVEKDRYNTVEFEAVETTGLRIDVKLQSDFSGGILQWKTE